MKKTRFARLALAFTACAGALALGSAPNPLAAQASATTPAPSSGSSSGGSASSPGATVALPSGYGAIALGMGFEEVDAALVKDSLYAYRGRPDVSLLPSPDMTLIETTGTTFIKRAYFQFYEGKLFTIILVLNPDRIDHYSMYASLVSKYGEPGSFSPEAAIWEDGAVRLSLERPLTLKYVDSKTLDALLADSGKKKTLEDFTREQFLNGL